MAWAWAWEVGRAGAAGAESHALGCGAVWLLWALAPRPRLLKISESEATVIHVIPTPSVPTLLRPGFAGLAAKPATSGSNQECFVHGGRRA